MKKITSFVVAMLMVVGTMSGITFNASAANPLGYSVQSTKSGGNVSSTYQGNALEIGNEFTVTFDKNNFNWSATGDGTYNIGNCTNAWLTNSGAVVGQHVSVSAVSLNGTTGSVQLTVKALRAYNGAFSLAMNSGAGSTTAFQTTLIINDTISTITATKAGGTAPYIISPTGTSVSIKTGEKITYVVPANNFTWNGASANKNATITDKSWIKLNSASLGSDFAAEYGTPATNGDVAVVLTALRTASYSNVSLYLSNGISTTASAPISVAVSSSGDGKITGIASDAQLGGKWSGALLNGTAISSSKLSNLDIQKDDELLLPLKAGFFTWDKTPPYSGSGVTTSELRQGKIKVVAGKRTGGHVFASKSPEIVQRDGLAYVKVKFTEPATNTKDVDFSMTIYMTVNGSRNNDSSLEISGSFVRDIVQVYKDENYFDLSDGLVLETDSYYRNIELYLGNGVTMYANLLSGKRYAGKAEFDITSEDEETMRKYPDIDEIVTLKTTNLDRGGNKVKFERSSNYYVYDKNFNYLGRTNEKLPYSSKYYLSTKELDIKTEDLSNLNDTIPTITSGDVINNVNENPPTGF